MSDQPAPFDKSTDPAYMDYGGTLGVQIDEGDALRIMLDVDGLLFIQQGDREGDRIDFAVNLSDVFYWGCADSEEIKFKEVESVYLAWRGGSFGTVKWACRKRGMRPQPPVEKRMRERGAWEDWLDALPNCYEVNEAQKAEVPA